MSYMMYAPTRVLFGPGQLDHLHEQTMPGEKAMLVISQGKSVRWPGRKSSYKKRVSLWRCSAR